MNKLISLLVSCAVLAGLLSVVNTSSAASGPSILGAEAGGPVVQVALAETPSGAPHEALIPSTTTLASDDTDAALGVNGGLLAAATVLTFWALRRRLF